MHSFVKALYLSTTIALTLSLTACSDGTQVFSSSASTGSAQQKGGAGAGGYYKIGNPYQVAGVWYYPKEDYSHKEMGVASWYGPDFHNGITANGELYDMHGLTAAHRTLPLPSVVRVTNMQNGRSLVLRVNDRGPFVNDRVIDVSKRAAQMLGFHEQGTTQVQVELLAEESKALKEELIAVGAVTAAGAASVAALEAPEFSTAPIQEETLVAPKPAPPRELPHSPNYPRLANPRPALSATDAPLIAGAAVGASESYNDWDNDLPKAQANRIVYEANETKKPAAPAPVKSAPAPKPVQKTAPAAVVSSSAIASGYYVQVGAFGSVENARKMQNNVSRFGEALILPVSVNGKQLYRVRLGPSNAKKALETMDRVTAAGFTDARLVEEKTPTVGKRLDSAF